MKLSQTLAGSTLRIHMDGDVLASECDCLARFWDRHLPDGSTIDEIRIDMSAVDQIDAAGVGQLMHLIRRQLESGRRVTLESPPQVLAHTLYKVGLLHGSRAVSVSNPRQEEPYAG